MSGYWMKVEETYDSSELKPEDHLRRFMVQYSMPGLGFSCEVEVDRDTKNLLKVAIEHGKNLARAEMRAVLGVRE